MGEVLRYPWINLKTDLWRFMSIPIWLFYLLFYIVAAVQLILLLYHRHKFPSYHSTVLVIGYVFAGLRLVYFGKGLFVPVSNEWVNIIEEILCWFPLNLQYLMISLLFVFNTKIIKGRHWTKVHHIYLSVWAASNGAYLVLSIAWFAVVGVSIYGDESVVWSRYLMTIIPDLVIIGCVLVFWFVGQKQRILRSSEKNWWARSMVLNFVIALFLLFRVILFVFMGVYLLTPVFLEVSLSKTTFDVMRMLMFVLSEIIPVIAILIYLKQIPGTRANPISRDHQTTLPKQSGPLPAHYRLPEEVRYGGSYMDGSLYSRSSPFRYGTYEDSYAGGSPSVISKSDHSGFSQGRSLGKSDKLSEDDEDDAYVPQVPGPEADAAPLFSANATSDTPTLVKSPMLSNMS